MCFISRIRSSVSQGPRLIYLAAALFFSAGGWTGAASSPGKEIVFEETVIEGKLKRPQVVLIAADQRPVFQPMAINNFRDTLATWADRVDPEIFEQNRFETPIQLELRSEK